MLLNQETDVWSHFISVMKERASPIEFENWFASIRLVAATSTEVTVEVPNIFVQEYLLMNYKKELSSFLPLRSPGEPALHFQIAEKKESRPPPPTKPDREDASPPRLNLT